MYETLFAKMDPVIQGWSTDFPGEPAGYDARRSLTAIGLFVAADKGSYDSAVSSMVILMSFCGYWGGRTHLAEAFDRNAKAPRTLDKIVNGVMGELVPLEVDVHTARLAGVAIAAGSHLEAIIKAEAAPRLDTMRQEIIEKLGDSDDPRTRTYQATYFDFGVGLSSMLK